MTNFMRTSVETLVEEGGRKLDAEIEALVEKGWTREEAHTFVVKQQIAEIERLLLYRGSSGKWWEVRNWWKFLLPLIAALAISGWLWWWL